MSKKIFISIAVSIFFLASCAENKKISPDKISGDLIVFNAGSLIIPFKKIKNEFNKKYPDVNVMLETAGSRTCARKITDMNRPCDIMASADYTVINKLLIPEYADWNIKFAKNEMCIVYHKNSRLSKKINKNNWYEILMDNNVAFGRADPNADPCGYRAVLTSKLAEKHYKIPGLAKKILNKDKEFVRPKETDLLALLESDNIDYIFLYRSVGQQHKLKCLILPDEINLKSAKFTDYYKEATVEITGKKPGEFITKKGTPMVYGITIPNNAPNRKAALAFIDFLLSKESGMKIIEKLGQASAIPSKSRTYNSIPESLQKYAKE